MVKGFVVVLALLAAATARPDPQYIYSADPLYGTTLSAYTAPVAPIAPVAPVVTAAVPATTLPLPSVYPGLYPSLISAYAYSFQSTYGEVPAANLISAYPSAPLTSRYSSLPYAYVDYLSYRQ